MAGKEIRLGVIGMSEGNGHPYSWSAICNGYDSEAMCACPFPVIPSYLDEQDWPSARLQGVKVTHIWTQEKSVSQHIAKASLIDQVVDDLEDLIGEVDAILLARDDADRHVEMAVPFLKAGIPVYIDKPLATSMADAKAMIDAKQYEGQLFTCSSLRYANELQLSDREWDEIGILLWVEASISKNWDTYAIHLLEAIVAQCDNRGNFIEVKSSYKNGIKHSLVEWENLLAYLKLTGEHQSQIDFLYKGDKGQVRKVFKDSFSSFKRSLESFIDQIKTRINQIPVEETLELVKILESGR